MERPFHFEYSAFAGGLSKVSVTGGTSGCGWSDDGAHLHQQAVKSDRFLDVAAQQDGDLVDAFHGVDDPGAGDFLRERVGLASEVEVPDGGAAFAEDGDVAEQVVEELEVELELFAFAASHGFGDGEP